MYMRVRVRVCVCVCVCVCVRACVHTYLIVCEKLVFVHGSFNAKDILSFLLSYRTMYSDAHNVSVRITPLHSSRTNKDTHSTCTDVQALQNRYNGCTICHPLSSTRVVTRVTNDAVTGL